MCCLTYSYIAILYSICQCTVLNLLSRREKKEEKGEKKVSDTANGIGWDSTGWEKEKQGVSESAGGKKSSKCCLLISAPTTAPQVRRLPDVVGCGAEKLVSPE